MASAVGVNNNLPWERHWSSPLQSAHSGGWDQYSALRAANRDVSFNIAGDGNCCPRAVAAQIVDNDATVRANPALSAYRVSPLISRDHIGLRAQFVEWLRANAHILQNPKVLEWMHPCTSVSAYAEHVSRQGQWMGSLFLHWAAGAMRTANSEPMLLNYVLSDVEVGLDATRTTGQLFQVLPIPSASGPGSAWPYDASPHLTSAPFASDFCPVRKVSGDYVCPAHGLVVCNSSPGVHWEQCRALQSTTPEASRTRSQMPVVPVQPIFSVSLNDARIHEFIDHAIDSKLPLVIRGEWPASTVTAVSESIKVAAREDKNSLWFTDRGNKVSYFDALHGRASGLGVYCKIVGGNTPAEDHALQLRHPFRNVMLHNPVDPKPAATLAMLYSRRFCPPTLGHHWNVVPLADMKVPMDVLVEVKSNVLVSILDQLYRMHKLPGHVKTRDTMLSLTLEHQHLVESLLPELSVRSLVRSELRGVVYVPTDTCINFCIMTSHNADSQNTPCHQDGFTNRHMVYAGSKAWVTCPPTSISNDTGGRGTFVNEKIDCNHRTHPQLPWQSAVLGPGDVIILPANWWHLVRSSASSMSVTKFVPEFLEQKPRQPKSRRRKVDKSQRYSVSDGPVPPQVSPNPCEIESSSSQSLVGTSSGSDANGAARKGSSSTAKRIRKSVRPRAGSCEGAEAGDCAQAAADVSMDAHLAQELAMDIATDVMNDMLLESARADKPTPTTTLDAIHTATHNLGAMPNAPHDFEPMPFAPTAASLQMDNAPCEMSSPTLERNLAISAREIHGKDTPHPDAPQLCPRTMGPPGTPVWCSRGYPHSSRFPMPSYKESGQPHLLPIPLAHNAWFRDAKGRLGTCYNDNKSLDWLQVSTSDSEEAVVGHSTGVLSIFLCV